MLEETTGPDQERGPEEDAESIVVDDRVEEAVGEALGAAAKDEAVAPGAEVAPTEGVEVGELAEEIESLRELYLRKLAEFDNFRKRTEREREELARTASEGLVRELTPVIDNFSRALEHAHDVDPDAFRDGVAMIAKQLWDVLARQGLEVVDPLGQPFDPERHEAVQTVPDSEHEPGTVVWVAARGYLLGGRLLRPATVGVAVEAADGPEEEDEAATEREGEAVR